MMRVSISFCNEAGSLVPSFPEDTDRMLERFDDLHQLSSHRFERWSGSFKNPASDLLESHVSLSLSCHLLWPTVWRCSLTNQWEMQCLSSCSRSWWRRPRLRSHCGLVRLSVRPDGPCNDLFPHCCACCFVLMARTTSPVSADAVLHVVAAFTIIASFPSCAALHHRLLHVVRLTITTFSHLASDTLSTSPFGDVWAESEVSPW